MTVVPELSNTDYHALPSLSASGAKILLQEGGPAKYRWTMDNPQDPKDEFDFGTAVHTLVLGTGDPIKPLPFKAWNEKGAKAAKDKARADGYVPLKVADYWTALRAARAVREHPAAAKILAEGVAEQSIQWTDAFTGVQLRCRPDWYRPGLLVDLKTAASASPTGFGKDADKFGYPLAAAFYLDGVLRAYGDEAAYVLIVVEKSPPYLVAVYEVPITDERGELTDEYRVGFEKYRRAVQIFHGCTESGEWPGYGDDIQPLKLPKWSAIEWDNQ